LRGTAPATSGRLSDAHRGVHCNTAVIWIPRFSDPLIWSRGRNLRWNFPLSPGWICCHRNSTRSQVAPASTASPGLREASTIPNSGARAGGGVGSRAQAGLLDSPSRSATSRLSRPRTGVRREDTRACMGGDARAMLGSAALPPQGFRARLGPGVLSPYGHCPCAVLPFDALSAHAEPPGDVLSLP